MPQKRLDAHGVFTMVGICALWGGNAVAVKYAVPDLPPLGAAAIRFALSLPILAIVCRLVGQKLWVDRSLWGLVAFNGLLAALQIGSFTWGTSHSAAGRSSIFINVHPLIVAPLAWIFLGEWMGRRGVCGLIAAAIGVAMVLSSSFRGGGEYLVGDLVVLGSGIVFAIQTIVQKKTFPHIAPATLLFVQSIVATGMVLACSGIVEGFGAYHFTPRACASMAFQGFAVSGICFAVWLLLLGRYPAGQLATVAFMTPIFGMGMSRVLRGEELTGTLVAGGLLVGLGIYLTASERGSRGEILETSTTPTPGHRSAEMG